MNFHMSNHDILGPALQKYYSALKSLYEFGLHGDFFDDVSNLDKFFSEFRNITFVVQKGAGRGENKAIYTDLRTQYLTGEISKWFIDTRNKTTKEKPFDLKKELFLNLYLPGGVITLTDSQLVVNFEDSFDDALEFIRTAFLEQFGLKEIFFSAKILFKESGSEIDIYPQIKCGLTQMNGFMMALEEQFPCDCPLCTELKKKISDLYFKVQSKELIFTRDYSFEDNGNITQGDVAEMYLSINNGEPSSISSMRLSLDNELFGTAKECLREVFLKFIIMHIVSFQLQDHQIMPVFMLVYNDTTYRMIPFVATTKATFYRKSLEIIATPDFDEVDAVFYCGEYYLYDLDQFPEINGRPYSERIEKAKTEVLAFSMMLKGGGEMEIHFDEQQIDDMEYVGKRITEVDWGKKFQAPFDWLNPVRQRLISVANPDKTDGDKATKQ